MYLKDLDGVIMVFDVANAKQSTSDLAEWFERLRAFEQRSDRSTPLPKMKFGNKRDLVHGVNWRNFDSSKVRVLCGRGGVGIVGWVVL